MIELLLEYGFAALAVCGAVGALGVLLLFLVMQIVNFCARRRQFNISEVRKLLCNLLVFSAICQFLDYFLI